MVLAPGALEQLKGKVGTIMTIPLNTGRFLDWKDGYPEVDK